MHGLRSSTTTRTVNTLHDRGMQQLCTDDPELAGLLDAELDAQVGSLALVAHASLAQPSVLAAAGSVLSNVTAEGYPGRRYHPGAEQFDRIERMAVERAKAAFGASYANVQPHSCSAANLVVLFSLLKPGDTVLGLDLDSGGHLTHGAAGSITGQVFEAAHYHVDEAGLVDYDEVARLAHEHRPRVIVAGASSYPRLLDYPRFRAIADEVGAYLLADISHIAGLVAAGVVPSPIDIAQVTTTSTYKQLGGPRGGVILAGRDGDVPGPDGRTPLGVLFDRGVFPRLQGTPNAAAIAAKARAFALLTGSAFRDTAERIVPAAKALAAALRRLGHVVLTDGTDNHIVLLDVGAAGLSGVVAERALRECGILANRNRIPGDTRPPLVSSGLRLGTNIVAQRGMGPVDAEHCAGLVDRVLRAAVATSDTTYRLDPDVRDEVAAGVARLLLAFPFPAYETGAA
jgi:glycine hydroxymethyltransferase